VALIASVAAYQAQLLTGFSTVTGGVIFAIVCGLLARLAEGPLEEQASFPAGRVLVPVLGVGAWLIIAANALTFSIHPLGAAGWAVLLGLGGLVAGVVFAFLPPAKSDGAAAPWLGWLRPVPICAGVGAALALWLAVVRPGAAWAMCAAEPAGGRLERLRQAVRWAPERPEVWVRLGECVNKAALAEADVARRGPLLREALRCAEEYAQLCPLSTDAHHQRGRALLELARIGQGSLDAVLSAYDDALKLDPGNVVLLRDAARAALALRGPERAEPYIDRAIGAGPRHGSILAEAAAIALSRGDLSTARATLDEALEAPWADDYDGLNRARGLMALIMLDCRDPRGALYQATILAAERPEWAASHVINGLALERLGRASDAAEAYTRAAGLDPGNVNALAGLRRLGR
jgi:tetratricopeptide (TPR) repeat protein